MANAGVRPGTDPGRPKGRGHRRAIVPLPCGVAPKRHPEPPRASVPGPKNESEQKSAGGILNARAEKEPLPIATDLASARRQDRDQCRPPGRIMELKLSLSQNHAGLTGRCETTDNVTAEP